MPLTVLKTGLEGSVAPSNEMLVAGAKSGACNSRADQEFSKAL
jgi:hypothetical protein